MHRVKCCSVPLRGWVCGLALRRMELILAWLRGLALRLVSRVLGWVFLPVRRLGHRCLRRHLSRLMLVCVMVMYLMSIRSRWTVGTDFELFILCVWHSLFVYNLDLANGCPTY